MYGYCNYYDNIQEINHYLTQKLINTLNNL